MYCINCGTYLEDGSNFCTDCGAKQPGADNVTQPQPTQRTTPVDESSTVMDDGLPDLPFQGTNTNVDFQPADPAPAWTPDAGSSPAPDPVPSWAPDTGSSPAPDPVPSWAPDTGSSPAPDTMTDGGNIWETAPQSQPSWGADVSPETEPIWPEDLNTVPDLNPESDAGPVTQPEPEPWTMESSQAWDQPQAQPAPWQDAQARPQPAPVPQPQPIPQPQPAPQPIPQPQPAPQPGPQTGTQAGAQTRNPASAQSKSGTSFITNTLFMTTPDPVFIAPAPAGGRRFLTDVHFGTEQKGHFEKNSVSDREFLDCLNEKLREKKLVTYAQFCPVVWDNVTTAQKEIVIDLPPKRADKCSAVISYKQNDHKTFLSQRIYPEASGIPVKEPEKPEKFFSGNGFVTGIIGLLMLVIGAQINSAATAASNFLDSYSPGTSSGSFAGVLAIICGLALIAYGIFVEYRNNQWAGIYNNWKAAKRARDFWYERNVTFLSNQIETGHPEYDTILDAIDEACLECFGEKPERS